jgi:hypothetical protein
MAHAMNEKYPFVAMKRCNISTVVLVDYVGRNNVRQFTDMLCQTRTNSLMYPLHSCCAVGTDSNDSLIESVSVQYTALVPSSVQYRPYWHRLKLCYSKGNERNCNCELLRQSSSCIEYYMH